MPYIICDNDNYLCQTTEGFLIVHDIQAASKWTKIDKANNVCKCINNYKKFQCYKLAVKYILQDNKVMNPPAKPIELEYDILDRVREIAEFTKQVEERRLYLMEMVHKADLEIVDIEHAAEFYNLNASQGYKLYKLLHDARNRRREYKTEKR